MPDLRPQESPESDNQALAATEMEGSGDLKVAAYRQQHSDEKTQNPANPRDVDKDNQKAGDDPNVLAYSSLSDKTPDGARRDGQRRRGDSNPRWRICNPLP